MNILSWFYPPASSNQYRIVRRLGDYEPQMSYTAGIAKGVFWYPLNPDGIWLEPEAFTYGNVTKHISLPKPEAERAVLRARAINGQSIRKIMS